MEFRIRSEIRRAFEGFASFCLIPAVYRPDKIPASLRIADAL